MLRRLKTCQPVSSLPVLSKTFSALLSAASGLILALPFINSGLWIFSWIGFVPLLTVLSRVSRPQAFCFAFLSGLVFWLATIYWLIHVTMAGMLVLVTYLALYSGIFGIIVSMQAGQSLRRSLFILPAAWVFLEYARSYLLTGFGWALLGYSQWRNVNMIQIADITGVWGVSFVVMMVNVSLYRAISGPCSAQCCPARKHVWALLAVLLCFLYGNARLAFLRQQPASRLSVAVIQGNIPQEVKWQVYSREHIVEKYLALSRTALPNDPALMVWPEAALPVVVEEEPRYFELVRQFAARNNIRLLFGAVTGTQDKYYNSAVYLDKEPARARRYNKIHLVPFGEYIPLRAFLGFLGSFAPIGEITPGTEYTLFEVGEKKFAVLICFEDLFPELARRFVSSGADFLVTITNDAWYKVSPAAYQHFQASVLRAVENRVAVVRAANTGVSGLIAPTGEVIRMLQDGTGNHLFADSAATLAVDIGQRRPTFYQRYPELFVALCAIVCMGALWKRRTNTRRL